MIILEYIKNLPQIFLENPIAQIIWFIAFFVSAYNFLFCKDRKFIIVTAIASFFWWLHFFLLWWGSSQVLMYGLISAALVNIFDIFKNLISLKYERNIYWVVWISIVYLVIWFFTFKWYLSVIPTLTAILSTYLVFYVRGVYLNLWFLVIILLWMIFNFLSGSIWWLMTDIFLFFFGLFGIYKMLQSEKKPKTEPAK